MILLIAIPVWLLAVSLIAGLCATASRGDTDRALTLAEHLRERARPTHARSTAAFVPPNVRARRAHTAQAPALERGRSRRRGLHKMITPEGAIASTMCAGAARAPKAHAPAPFPP